MKLREENRHLTAEVAHWKAVVAEFDTNSSAQQSSTKASSQEGASTQIAQLNGELDQLRSSHSEDIATLQVSYWFRWCSCSDVWFHGSIFNFSALTLGATSRAKVHLREAH